MAEQAAQLHFLSYLAEQGATNLHPEGRLATDCLIDALELSARLRVLEVGCGTGETIVQVCRRFPVSVDGLDVLPEMLRAATMRLHVTGLRNRSRLHLSRVGAPLPFADGAYDRVYTEGALGFQDAAVSESLVAEIVRVLKPGGLYVGNEAIWKRSLTEETVKAANEACLRDFGLRASSELAWTVDDWIALMKNAGFEVRSADTIVECIARSPRRSQRRKLDRLLVSDALTFAYRFKARFWPRLLRQRAHYREALAQQRPEQDSSLEGRLFIMRKT